MTPVAPSPAQVLNLGGLWKLTLPTGPKDNPTEISPAGLNTFSDPNWFHLTPENGVAFTAPVNGITTSGSSYPRCELREMAANGKAASWTSKSGTHTLVVNEAFTAVPAVKPHLVGAQIHDAKNDWATFRLEGSRLYVTNGNDPHAYLVTAGYVLGTRYEAKFIVGNKAIQAYYNGALVATIAAKKLKGAYFKAGAYTQANCTNSQPCSASNYGQTTIYGISVTHVA